MLIRLWYISEKDESMSQSTEFVRKKEIKFQYMPGWMKLNFQDISVTVSHGDRDQYAQVFTSVSDFNFFFINVHQGKVSKFLLPTRQVPHH